MLVKEILCHYVLKSWKGLKSFWRRWSSISWRMCACVCWSVVLAIHLHRRSSVRGWIFVQTPTPAWAGSAEPAVNAGWSELCRCSVWPGEGQHLWKRPYWRGGCHRKHCWPSLHQWDLLHESQIEAPGNASITHKKILKSVLNSIKHSFTTRCLFKMNGITNI